MTKRNPLTVFFFSTIGSGFYQIYWLVSTKLEMCKLGADIPTGWLVIVPFANFYWDWKYSQAVEQLTQGEMSRSMAFFLLQLDFILGIIIFILSIIIWENLDAMPWYLKYITSAGGGLGLAAIQDVLNSIKPSLLAPTDNWHLSTQE
jgi:hypothetical protein